MYKNYKILSLIAARAGSKGLKNKNIKKFLGKPLINWSILASKKSRYIDHTLVSTDSEKIINISKSLGVNAPFKRPKKLALDNSKIKDVIFHSLKWIKKKRYKFDFLILLQPTSPLRTAEHIDKFIRHYFAISKKKKETMVSITEAPIKAGLMMEIKDNYVKFSINQSKNKKDAQRQNLKQYFLPNGAIYFANIKKFNGNFFAKNTLYFKMDQSVSIDIDYIQDFKKGIKYKNNF